MFTPKDAVTANPLSKAALPRCPKLSGVTVVLLDLDDTLIDTLNNSFEVVCKSAKEAGLPTPSRQDYLKPYGGPFTKCVESWFPGMQVDPQSFREIFDRISLSHPAPPLFDVATLLAQLKSAGMLVGVVTNASARRTTFKLQCAGISPESLDCLVTQDDVAGVLKPSPVGIQLALQRLNITEPQQVIYVGNAVEDQQAAIRAGTHFCAVKQTEDWQARLDPDSLIIDSAAQVPYLFEVDKN